MASIDGAGRGGPNRAGATGRPAGESSVDEAAKSGRSKEKDRFGGLQKRKGALDKTAHATRVLNREQTRVNAPSSKRAQGVTQGVKQGVTQGGVKQGVKQGAAGGSAAGNKPRAVAQQPTQQPTQAPAKPPSAHAPTQASTQAATQASTQAAAPPKPQRAPAGQTPAQATAQASAQASAPPKPTRSAASLRRPEAQQRSPVVAQRAGSPRTLPRTIMNVSTTPPSTPPTASPRASATPGATPGGATSGATPRGGATFETVSGYDVLTNAATQRSGAQPKLLSGHDTIGRTPRPALRSPGGDKFLKREVGGGGGGFNPAATLGGNRSGVGTSAGDRPVLSSRRAQAPLPAPPRIGVGTRILNAIKNIFTLGAYGRAMSAQAHSGRVGIMLSDPALLFASDTHKHLRHSILELEDSKLSTSEQETYKLATSIIRDSLKPIGENVLADAEYHPDVIDKVANALLAIDKIVFDHTGVAYVAPDYDRGRPPEFPAEPATVSSLPDDRIYETLAEAQQAGGATGGAGTGGAGTGDRNV